MLPIILYGCTDWPRTQIAWGTPSEYRVAGGQTVYSKGCSICIHILSQVLVVNLWDRCVATIGPPEVEVWGNGSELA